MKKTEEMNEYLDWYGELLTEKQQDICDLYFKEDVNIPVKFVGLGEKEKDLRTFDIEKYIYGLFKDM